MSSNPKIVVLKTREIIYTLLLLVFIILLAVCLVLMFTGKKNQDGQNRTVSRQTAGSSENTGSDAPAAPQGSKEETSESSSPEPLLPEQSRETVSYTAGVYTSPLTLGASTVDVEVTVDQNHINSIRLVNLSEATAAAYPLVTPSLEHITSQILEKQSLEGITCPQENRYTSQLLLSAVAKALETAQAE